MATTRNWADIVAKADDENRHYDELYPVIYRFGTRPFRRGTPAYQTSQRRWSADSATVRADSDIFTADGLA